MVCALPNNSTTTKVNKVAGWSVTISPIAFKHNNQCPRLSAGIESLWTDASSFIRRVMFFARHNAFCLHKEQVPLCPPTGLIDVPVSALNKLVRDKTTIFVSVNACMREVAR